MPTTEKLHAAPETRGDTFTVVDVAGLSFHLTPGVINDEAVLAFTRGHCAELALALHDRTGWPLRIVVQANIDWVSLADDPAVLAAADQGHRIPYGYLQQLWAHVLVERPDGLLVDINGARTPDTVIDEHDWNGTGTAPLDDGPYRHRILAATRDDVDSLVSAAPRCPGAGKPFVDAVLALPDAPERPWPWQHTIAELDWAEEEALEDLAEYHLLAEAVRRDLVPKHLRPAALELLSA